jgi:aminopeptidase N
MNTLSRYMLAAVICGWGFAALAETPFGEAPYSFDSAFGRLPKNVVPTDYQVAVVPDAAKLALSGTESVTLQFRQATATIVFNSLNEKLHQVRLDGKPVKKVVSDDKQQLTTVTLAAPAKTGIHVLSFAYSGKIETSPDALFAQSYQTADGGKGLLLSTLLYPTEARRVFPCWDEPAFRAVFRLTVTVPAAWTTLSNMPVASRRTHGALATVTFQDSPKMPTYLLEFSGGDLAGISAESGGTRLGVWAVRGQEQGGEYALANAQQILADYNEYFGHPFPLPKLDSIAVPGDFQGAMENWGAITYNDQLLLVTPSSTDEDRQRVYSVQAHEMAHQWNGDLVTMGWWDYIWLNESFASWVSAMETDYRNPGWKWWEVQDADKERAMKADARVASHAIQQHVSDELQADNAADPEITYSKGQAVLRMFDNYLGHDTFRAGIRGFIKAHAYSNATSADLWKALSEASGKDVAKVAADWIEQSGFPLVSVTSTCDANGQRTVSLSQSRFLLRGTDPNNSHWNIPLQLRIGADGQPQSLLLSDNGQTAAAGRCDQPLSADAGAVGFYRVAYDDATLKLNTKNFASLPDTDRIALLDDQWALVEAGQAKLPSYLALASAMGDDLDARAWSQIARALETIEYDERGTTGHAAFAAYARSVLKPAAQRLGWDAKADDTPQVKKLRSIVLADLGCWGDPEVVAEARKRFAAFVADRSSLKPDEQQMVLTIVAQHADAATFEQLHAVAKSAKNENEMRRYYAGLMNVRDPQLAQQAVAIALSPEIPPQADALRFSLVAKMAEEHPDLSWKTFSENTDRLLKPMATVAPLVIAQYVPQFYWNAVPADQLEAWVKAHVPAGMSDNVARGMESARFRLSEKQALVPEADAYVSSLATVATKP